MARQINRLTPVKVRNLSAPGRYADGAGLYLEVGRSGAKSWTFLFSWGGKIRQKGLGPLRLVSLAEAREKARTLAKLVAEGVDPIAASAASIGKGIPTFGEVAIQVIEDRKSGWKNLKHQKQWRSTLETYASSIWHTPVDAVDLVAVLGILRPIWHTKPQTAKRVRGRIHTVLNAARLLGLRAGENPADILNIEPSLGRRNKTVKKHHAAMPYSEVPSFMQELGNVKGLGGKALELLIHTATRTSEVLGAKWSEFDLDNALWTIPAARMKMGQEHRVPLSAAVVSMLKAWPRVDEFLFPGLKEGSHCSNMVMAMVLRRLALHRYTVHGFRSSFRDWCADVAGAPREIAEQALAHSVGNEVERAYRRSDALAQRRQLMQAWSDYLTGKEVSS